MNRECWINVYALKSGYVYQVFKAHQSYYWCQKCDYRIHVKMKSALYYQQIGRIKRSAS